MEKMFEMSLILDCNDRCLVYLLTCNKCRKQYTGQKIENFHARQNSYKFQRRRFDRGEKCIQ